MRLLSTLLVALLVYVAFLRKRFNHWGATGAEFDVTLPGDDKLPQPQTMSTRAITINAPAETVWQWVVQIGQGRGGFYSYDGLENLFGLNIHSAARIEPALQNLQEGDVVRLAPDGGPSFRVAELQPARALVLQAVDPQTGAFADPTAPDYYGSTWSFILDSIDDQTTRLLIRGRGQVNSPFFRVFNYALEPITFLMEQKMLRGIKQRAESSTVAPQVA
jgi:hypothetical protein